MELLLYKSSAGRNARLSIFIDIKQEGADAPSFALSVNKPILVQFQPCFIQLIGPASA